MSFYDSSYFMRLELSIRYSFHSLGLIGNILLFFVYSQPSLRRLSVSIYFRCLAVMSSWQILFFFLIIPNFNRLALSSQVFYKIISYVSELCLPILSWLEVAATLDRFLTILFSMRVKFIKKKSIQLAIVASVIIYNMIFYSCILFKLEIPNLENIFTFLAFRETMNMMNLYNSSIVPFAIMILLSIATFSGVLRAHIRMKSSSSNVRRTNNRTLVRDIKFGATLVVLNLFYFIFIVFYRLQDYIDINPFYNHSMVYRVFEIIQRDLSQYYYQISFFIQIAVNSLVRKETLSLAKRVLSIFPYFRNILQDSIRSNRSN